MTAVVTLMASTEHGAQRFVYYVQDEDGTSFAFSTYDKFKVATMKGHTFAAKGKLLGEAAFIELCNSWGMTVRKVCLDPV